MLAELAIDNLVLIARARLELCPGLNVITGETGAGKTLLAQAVGLLMGQKGGDELIRQGASRAVVQALFETADGTLAVARELPRSGRSRFLLDGLLSSAAAVDEALERRLAFYGQLEHARLLQLGRQLELLDAAAARELAPLLAEYGVAYSAAREAARAVEDARAGGADRAREGELLRYQVAEIEAAQLHPGEDVALARERERLRHAGKLLERVGGAYALLAGEGDATALDSLRVAQRRLAEAAALDDSLGPLDEELIRLHAELDDAAAQVRAYIEELDVEPGRRDAVELRYDAVKTLLRKYGESADAVLAHADEARLRLERLAQTQDDAGRAEAALQAARERALAAAGALSSARRRAAARLAPLIEEELHRLAMPHATFGIVVGGRGEGWEALGPRGADQVEFRFSANPGVPPRPLRETASGGELARAMLAIRGIVPLGDDVETLIFDEVDQGIGGLTASAVGERLARLARHRQVVCITHLPQVAAYGERHFAIVKAADVEAGTTETTVNEVSGEARLAELCRMLGAAPADRAAREHAEGLLAKAASAG